MGFGLTDQGAHWAGLDFMREIKDVAGDGGPDKELGDLVAEVVAVVFQEAVSLHGVARADFREILFEEIFGDMSHSKMDHFHRSAIRRCAYWSMLDASTKIVLIAIDHDSCVPDKGSKVYRTG